MSLQFTDFTNDLNVQKRILEQKDQNTSKYLFSNV
jgi:hypothetical protein